MLRRVAAEPAALFGAGRALLLQVAHPNVAQGVSEHSQFQTDPFARLAGTLEAMYAVTFGSTDLAATVGGRIHDAHDHVIGAGYRANDPENLLWVHASLVDTLLYCYERLVHRLADAEREQLYQEMARIAQIFGCPREEQPATYPLFRAYFDHLVETLQVTETGRQLAHDIVRPELPLVLRPALSVFGLVAVGTTPPRLREQLGFAWTARDQWLLRRVERATAAAVWVTPQPLRIAPGQMLGRGLLRAAARRSGG